MDILAGICFLAVGAVVVWMLHLAKAGNEDPDHTENKKK